MADKKNYAYSGYPFPKTPSNWNQEERQFARGLESVFDEMYISGMLKKAYPIGIVVLTGTNQVPFSFGKWVSVSTGISGVYGWKRKA